MAQAPSVPRADARQARKIAWRSRLVLPPKPHRGIAAPSAAFSPAPAAQSLANVSVQATIVRQWTRPEPSSPTNSSPTPTSAEAELSAPHQIVLTPEHVSAFLTAATEQNNPSSDSSITEQAELLPVTPDPQAPTPAAATITRLLAQRATREPVRSASASAPVGITAPPAARQLQAVPNQEVVPQFDSLPSAPSGVALPTDQAIGTHTKPLPTVLSNFRQSLRSSESDAGELSPASASPSNPTPSQTPAKARPVIYSGLDPAPVSLSTKGPIRVSRSFFRKYSFSMPHFLESWAGVGIMAGAMILTMGLAIYFVYRFFFE